MLDLTTPAGSPTGSRGGAALVEPARKRQRGPQLLDLTASSDVSQAKDRDGAPEPEAGQEGCEVTSPVAAAGAAPDRRVQPLQGLQDSQDAIESLQHGPGLVK